MNTKLNKLGKAAKGSRRSSNAISHGHILRLYEDLIEEIIAASPETAAGAVKAYIELIRRHPRYVDGRLNPLFESVENSLFENWGDTWRAAQSTISALMTIGVAVRAPKRQPDMRDFFLYGEACHWVGRLQGGLSIYRESEAWDDDGDFERQEAQQERNRRKGCLTQSNRRDQVEHFARQLATEGAYRSKKEAAMAIRQKVTDYAKSVGHNLGTRLRTIEDMLTGIDFRRGTSYVTP